MYCPIVGTVVPEQDVCLLSTKGFSVCQSTVNRVGLATSRVFPVTLIYGQTLMSYLLL